MRTTRAAWFCILTALALSSIGNAAAQEASRPPYLSLEKDKPTKDKIEAFLKGGVEFNGEDVILLTNTGSADFQKPLVAGVDNNRFCQCETPVEYHIEKNTIVFECVYSCSRAAWGISGEPQKLLSRGPKRFAFRVVAV